MNELQKYRNEIKKNAKALAKEALKLNKGNILSAKMSLMQSVSLLKDEALKQEK